MSRMLAHYPDQRSPHRAKPQSGSPARRRAGFSDQRTEMRALDLGAADFIAQPYNPAALQARVRNLLDLKRRTDAELDAVRDDHAGER